MKTAAMSHKNGKASTKNVQKFSWVASKKEYPIYTEEKDNTAKEVRGLVDGMITTAKRGDLSARRALASQIPHEPLIVDKLMGEIAEKYAERSSGYTRIVKIGERLGDAAPIVQIELV